MHMLAAQSILMMLGAPAYAAGLPEDRPPIPVIDGDFWSVASNPDLGPYTTPHQQPVDFAVWQAADGTWQLWSCIRGTACGGNTRLFYGWEGKNLTDSDWEPKGIKMTADPSLGETPGGLQAPHVVKHDGLYWMAYGDWNNICFATSKDGKEFTRVVRDDGVTGAFTEGPDANTRDAMLINIGGLWHCYYTGFPGFKGYVFCRTSTDLHNWSPSCAVMYGGTPGPGMCEAECPHVVELQPGLFYLFRNQYYGQNQLNWVYCSSNPLYFGIDSDAKLVRSWPVAAPEIIHHEGQYYIAALTANLDGIRIARLKFLPREEALKPVFDFDNPDERARWTVKEGSLDGVFTDSTRADFRGRFKHFIGTAETADGACDEARTGIVESPPFTVENDEYYILVSGGFDFRFTYIDLVDRETGKEFYRVAGHNDEIFREVTVPCHKHKGREAFVRIVDNSPGPWGHINFGGLFTLR